MAPRILIVDDHQIVRQGVRTLLAEFRPDWEIAGEASDASEALRAITALKPDLVVLDITMPGTSGLELASQVRSLGLPTQILIFTMHHSNRIGTDVRAAGAQGYVLKSQAARDLVFAIEKILGGGTFYGHESEGGGGGEPSPGRNVFFFSRLRLARGF
jgi:DNA-binding NarL/FixJ family response regulator